MATTLPSLTETIDNAFLHTWYKIRPKAIDNILKGTPIWAWLKEKGCLKRQVGGRLITRTVQYDYVEPTEFARGELLGEGEKETDTMAIWTWRRLAAPIQRTLVDDQENQGEDKIRDLVKTKTERVMQGFPQKHEKDLFNTHVSAETGKLVQGFRDLIPASTDRAAGTYGKINRPTTFSSDVATVGNLWWTPMYKQITGPIDVSLVSDMRTIYYNVEANQESPDGIITDQTTYELYEEFGQDASMIMLNGTTKRILDLGFQALQFKGATMMYSPNMDVASNMLFLTSAYLEIVYDPTYFAAMSHWKDTSGGKSGDRIAHVVSVLNMVSPQLRRFGRLYL